jgi:hypothetical protein
MNSLRIFGVRVLMVVGLAVAATAQDKPSIVTVATSEFATPAGFPACVASAVQHGDPSKGASVILNKLTAGCFTPWHWHTTNEGGVVVSQLYDLICLEDALRSISGVSLDGGASAGTAPGTDNEDSL